MSGINNPTIDASTLTTGTLAVARGGTGVAALPSFSVHKNGTNQTGIVANTFTKVTWSTEVFDTNSNFASDGFTPTVAGKYLFTVAILWNNTTSASIEILVALYKNGVIQLDNRLITPVANQFEASNMVAIMDANGSTDVFEIYVRHQDSANRVVYGGAAETYWMGAWIAP
jgi:hypothetical protein